MRVLVTGGAGFLGSHVCDRLHADGHDVLCLDNFFTGSRRNVGHLEGKGRFRIIEHDVVDPLDVPCDQIYHLACPASPVHYQHDPVKTWKTSVLGILHLLELAERNKARILYASTSEVYGDPAMHPQREEYWGNVNPVGLRSCYDEGKRAAETLAMDYHRTKGAEVRVIRIFNTYGPRMHANDGRVVSNFIVQALQGRDITVYGKGTQTRSFCYVDDLIAGMARMMAAERFTGPVNLGNPEEYTILDLARKIIAMTGSSSKVVYRPLPSDDPTQRRPDISLAGEKLGWRPSVSVDDGLRRTIEHFRKELAG